MFEQYSTDPEIAGEILWFAYMQGDIKGKIIADFGCGPGIFGIGAALLLAKQVFFVDKDSNAIKICMKNIGLISDKLNKPSFKIIESDIDNFSQKVDVVLQNPPFGTKIKHHDRIFLKKAFEISDVVYSLHKITSNNFIEAFSKDSGFKLTHILPFKMNLKRSYDFHKKPKYAIDIACYRIASKRFK